jgi:hypothetical protein
MKQSHQLFLRYERIHLVLFNSVILPNFLLLEPLLTKIFLDHEDSPLLLYSSLYTGTEAVIDRNL